MNNRRRQSKPHEEVNILRLYLLEQKPVSDVCDEYGLNPTVFYRWQKQFFEQGAAAFERDNNGSAFIARDFKEFIRISGMTHVRTSPYYPQSNGKVERWHQSLKRECIRPKTPLTIEQVRRVAAGYVHQYNTKRLHSAIGYVMPLDKLHGRAEQIFAERDAKLADAREARRRSRATG